MKATKRNMILLLALCLVSVLLCGCGAKEEAAAPDMQKVFDAMTSAGILPDMVVVPPEKGEIYFGIAPGDCVQEVTAIGQSSMLADEIWLIEAGSSKSADTVEALAKARISQKCEELKNYAPDQYEIAKNGKLIREGNCVILLISAQGEKLQEIYNSAK